MKRQSEFHKWIVKTLIHKHIERQEIRRMANNLQTNIEEDLHRATQRFMGENGGDSSSK